MDRPLLTIGMAHHQDFSGLWATIQSIRINNAAITHQIEFVVVNNSSEDVNTASAIRGLLSVPHREGHDYTTGVSGKPAGTAGSQYVELKDTKGTSASRNKIFEHATGKYVIVMDCHLELTSQTIPLILKHYEQDPESCDLITGPLLLDSLQGCQTHFRDEWSEGMWGRWSLAWQCQCGPDGSLFELERSESGTSQPKKMQLGGMPIHECAACRKPIPEFVWEGHERKYRDNGYGSLGMEPGPAFEIPGQGLGFFSCRREAWLGFNRDAKAFGAEELCVHEKYRQAGHKALCVPGALWCHRFYREGGHKYPNTNFDKARNYVLWYKELGLDLEVVRKHFVETPLQHYLTKNPPETRYLLSQVGWDELVRDPINTTEDPTNRILATQQAEKMLPDLRTPEQIYDTLRSTPRDLDQHMDSLKILAGLAEGTVVELTARKESTVAFLAGRPKQVISYSSEIEPHSWKMSGLVRETTGYIPRAFDCQSFVKDLPESDLLFIDTVHKFDFLLAELRTYSMKCRRFIVLHDTELYGLQGIDEKFGLKLAVMEFCRLAPEWSVIDHTKEQYGLTVLSKLDVDKPEKLVEGFHYPYGPGTELKVLLSMLGINPAAGCGCHTKALQMNVWGVEGCQKPENFKTITEWLQGQAWPKFDLLKLAGALVLGGLAFQINPLRPYESLVEMAIENTINGKNKPKA